GQSNSSVVFDDRVVLKLFRKLEPGINPELEMLRFLTGREFESIAPLYGWYDYDGQALAATLGVAQEFLPDAVGGWELVLDQIGSEPAWLLDRLARRLPPGTDAPHASGMGDHRLRGRTSAPAARAPCEALAATRHRGDAALVRLCHIGGPDSARHAGSVRF